MTCKGNGMVLKWRFLVYVVFYVVLTDAVIAFIKHYDDIYCAFSSSLVFHTPPESKIPPFQWKGTGLVTLWFDDNLSSQYEHAFPIMQKFGFKGALSVITQAICAPSYMTLGQIYTLERNGWEIVSHSKYHVCSPYILEHSPMLLQAEVEESKKFLSDKKIHTNIFVTPCGYESYAYPAIDKSIRKHYTAVRVADSWSNYIPAANFPIINSFFVDNTTDFGYIEREIQAAKKNYKWIVLTFHQVGGDKPPLNISTENFTRILNVVKNSGLPVVLPSQVLSIPKEEKPK